MANFNESNLGELVELSRLLGEFGQIKRATILPGGEQETDSHHSFSLALIAYELARQYAPELDSRRVLLYSLVHDLPELITGDVVTLNATPDELERKARNDEAALEATKLRFASAPHIMEALDRYEKKDDDESVFVYWLDKMITIPTHFYDNGANLRKLGIHSKRDIQTWYERTIAKLEKQKRKPHESATVILEMAYKKMRDELVGD